MSFNMAHPVSQVYRAYRKFAFQCVIQRSLSLSSANFSLSSQENAKKGKFDDASTTQSPKEKIVSDWIKDIQKGDERSPLKYRRQDYPDPVARTVGILRDDLKIFFGNIYSAFKIIFGSNAHDYIHEDKFEKTQSTKSSSGVVSENAKDTSSKPSPPVAKKSKEGRWANFAKGIAGQSPEVWPGNCDFLVIGGGAVGSSVAYHLSKQVSDGASIVVVEKDLSYKHSSTVLSVGGIRHQFSVPENILLSMYGMQFMMDLPRLLKVPGEDPPCINFHPHGYLTLASEQGFDQLKENYTIQRHFNAQVKLLEPRELKEQFPWMCSQDLAGGVLGVEGEGWFDPWSLLSALRRKAIHQGVKYIEAEVTGFDFMDGQKPVEFIDGHPPTSQFCVSNVNVRLQNGEQRTISPSVVVLAAGAQTGNICYDMMGIGKTKEGLMAYPVPIEPRKRYVYCFHAPKGPGLATPLVIDPCGAYFRREGFGNMFLAGMSPSEEEEPPCDNFEVDHEYFVDRVWPAIAKRVPGFNELKVQGSWSGFYEYNIFDQNGIVGMHPVVDNLMLAAGFSGHGIQHSVGVGRAVMERLLFSEYRTIDMTRFELERIHLNEPIYEHGIV